VRQPSAFLFDEPLSNLDAALRGTMRLEISELHQQLKTTMVYVTHDQVEAMTMADKIVVLNAGNIEQVGSPLELYRSPSNLFVAGFIGSPRMNFIDGEPARKRDAARIGVRPEHIAISTTAGEWKGVVGVAEHLGSDTFLHIHTSDQGTINVRVDGELAVAEGDTVYLTPDAKRLHRFDEQGKALR
jgi:multiple sugar transport system ATP-binding protein